MQSPKRMSLILICAAAGAYCPPVPAGELLITRDAVQALVVETLFSDHGKWLLVKGACYAYLERPRIGLTAGRLTIEGYLSARVGLDVGGSCVGTEFASDVRLSGRLVAAGSRITLSDIRIDYVKDDSTRQALELLQSAAGTALPRAVDIDLLNMLEPSIVPGTSIRVTVTQLDVRTVTTSPDRVTVNFEMNLTAR
jgi:hypothetical protein